jgi:hypothetical protein
MPLVIKGRGHVVLKPEPPVMSRLWTPPKPQRPVSRDACRIQTAFLFTPRKANSYGV